MEIHEIKEEINIVKIEIRRFKKKIQNGEAIYSKRLLECKEELNELVDLLANKRNEIIDSID